MIKERKDKKVQGLLKGGPQSVRFKLFGAIRIRAWTLLEVLLRACRACIILKGLKEKGYNQWT